MKKIMVVLVVLYISLFSTVWGQERLDADAPIQGGFKHDPATRINIIEWNEKTGDINRSYFVKLYNSKETRVEIYNINFSLVGGFITHLRDDFYLRFPLPSGIYFIKIGEKVRAFYLLTGSKIELLMY